MTALYLDIAGLTQAYRQLELSPLQVMEQVFQRIDQLDPALRLFTWLDREQALAQARQAEADYREGRSVGALHGVPVSIKDNLGVAGAPQTFGSRLYQDHRASADNVVVQRLRAAGAIVVGITTMPEFGTKATTDSPLHGITRNPWAPSRTPGGSSGGSAAAVAAGIGPLALGTDVAGSVRIPASCCHLVGLKPTLGVIPVVEAADGFAQLAHVGPLTRTVADTALALQLLAGADPRDPWSLGVAHQDYARQARPDGRLDGVRIAWLDLPIPNVDPQVIDIGLAAVERLRALGAHVERIALDLHGDAERFGILVASQHHARHAPRLAEDSALFDPVFRQRLEHAAGIDWQTLGDAGEARNRVFARIQALFEDYDFLASPTLTRPPIAADANLAGNTEGAQQARHYIDYLYPFNLSGHPALSLPAGFSADGLPVGLQLVAPWYADGPLLKVAAELEALLGLTDRHPDLEPFDV
jgi:Asp-tRNA(Asn)/Glu-tRNA(Gln) amidotransferase A subunit family amidase